MAAVAGGNAVFPAARLRTRAGRIAATRDTVILKLLSGVRERSPSLYGRLSDVRRAYTDLAERHTRGKRVLIP